MREYVIIGNGTAAAACIEGIRTQDKEGRITVISAENHPVYCRPLISYYLEGKTDRARMAYRAADFYASNGVKVLYGRTAVALDPAAKRVTLDDGSGIGYTALCAATGSSPFVPPFAGLETVDKIYSFMTLDDAEALKAAVTKASRVLIVGAGLIGLKCAEGLKASAGEITVCDLAPRVLSSILDDECAAVVKEHLEKNGLCLLTGDSVARFAGHTAHMQSGREIPFDVLVTAVGVRANTELLRACGGKVGRGILVDERMQTNLEGVFAAGDCTEGTDITSGQKKVLALMPNAYMQGFAAGVNMAGGDRVYDNAMPLNAVGFFGLHMMTAGTRFSPEEGGEVFTERGEGFIKKLFCRGGVMTGFILLGKTARAGIYTGMIRNRTPLDEVDFALLKKNPTSAAFSKITRRNMFGGVV